MMNRESINFFRQKGYFLFPKMLQFEITLRCPFNCYQCYKKHLVDQDIDYYELVNMIKEAAKNGVSLITLNGGEPLLYPRIYDLLSEVGKMDISVNVFSSGFDLKNDVIDLLEKHDNINFYISLNGSSGKINSLSREGFKVSTLAIEKLYHSNAKFGINWVARHDNVKDFPNMLELCRTFNASFISITSNKLTGYEKIQSPLTNSDIVFLSEYINYREDLSPSIFIESCFSMLSTQIIGNKNNFSAHCYAGISSCTVNCDGTFQPCTHLKYPEKYETLEKYWHKSNILKKLRDNPPENLEPCNNCKHNKICSLCRAMSSKTYDDFSVGTDKCLSYLT